MRGTIADPGRPPGTFTCQWTRIEGANEDVPPGVPGATAHRALVEMPCPRATGRSPGRISGANPTHRAAWAASAVSRAFEDAPVPIRFRADGGTVHAEDPGGIALSAGRSDEETGVVKSSRRGGWS